jgi:hypothetical protein
MDDLKYFFKILIRLVLGTVFISCGSKGAILYDQNTKSEISEYILETRKLVDISGDSLEVVFHRAGSFQEYAKNVNVEKFKYGSGCTAVKDVTVLMDRSFKELAADGIEIDAQTVPASSDYPKVYIVHDRIDGGKLSVKAKAYLVKNTLTEVLTHFIRKQYFRPHTESPSGKYLFIELKIPKQHLHVNHSPLDPKQKQYIAKIIRELQQTIQSAAGTGDMATAVRRHIGFASFNLYALEYANEFALSNNQSGYAYNFIAGTNRGLLGYLANIFGSREINYLNAELTQRLISHEWLTGIWFDPAGINHMADTFNEINHKRESPLFYYISTYNLKRDSYLKRLCKGIAVDDNGEPIKLKKVRGLIFDILAREACHSANYTNLQAPHRYGRTPRILSNPD